MILRSLDTLTPTQLRRHRPFALLTEHEHDEYESDASPSCAATEVMTNECLAVLLGFLPTEAGDRALAL